MLTLLHLKANEASPMAFSGKSIGDPARLAELLSIFQAFPEAEFSGSPNITFRVRKKTFAYYLDNHHDDGRVAVSCKTNFDRQAELVKRHPERYYIPPYIGPRGWVALRLDLKSVDWNEVRDLARDSYRLQAPPRLAEQVE